jgi:hypothetical protein
MKLIWRRLGMGIGLAVLCGVSLLAQAGLPSRPDAEEQPELGGSVALSGRLRDYELRDSVLLPARGNTAETLLAGEWAADSWWASGYLDLQHQWLGGQDQDASQYKLGQLYWHPLLGESWQLQIGKFSLDLDPSYTTHPAGFFQAATSPFDDFLPDVGIPMATLTHWFDERWSAHLVAASEGPASQYQGEAQWGGVVQYEAQGWTLTGLLQQYQSSPLAVGGTYLYSDDGAWSWHGSWVSRGQGDEKLNLMLGGVWQDDSQMLVLEYGYDRSRYTYRQLWQQMTGRDGLRLPQQTWLDEAHDTEHQSLYGEYDWENEQRQVRLAAMLAQDGSAITQLRHTWLHEQPWRWWLEAQRSLGDEGTTYGRLPWLWQCQAGISWQF